MSVKNKTCLICTRAENRSMLPVDHRCSKNFSGSSTSMEPIAISEGFRSSVADRGLRYRYLVADGDRATYHKILQENPYHDVKMKVMKISCKNHILRRLCTNLRNLTNGITRSRVNPCDLENLSSRNNLFRVKFSEYAW